MLIFVDDNFLNSLKAWYALDKAAGQGYIIHYNGGPVLKILKAWKSALARAGIRRRLRPYDLRHHFVTTALEGGADIKAVSEVVGSRPKTLIKYYQHVTGAMHRAAVAKIPTLSLKDYGPADEN